MSKKISIILLFFLSVVLGLWIWSAIVPKNSIILGGSTSVNPFMQKLTKQYYESSNDANDFIYNSTGSQAGVDGVEKEMYAAGFISKDINSGTLSKGNTFLDLCGQDLDDCNYDDKKSSVNKNNKPKNDSYVALKFAIDAIGIIYNAPTYWDQVITYGDNKTITLNKLMNFVIEKNSVNKLLVGIYSGSKQWKDIAMELIEPYDNHNQLLYKEMKNLIEGQSGTKLVTYTRESGSGTRTAFSDLTGVKDMQNSNVVNSNGSMIQKMQKGPSLGYISNGFLANLDPKGSIKIAGINGFKLPLGNTKPQKWNIKKNDWENWTSRSILNNDLRDEFIKNEYSLKRPFVAVFNTYNKHLDELIRLFDFINDKKSNEVFESEGLVREMEFQSSKKGGTYA